MSEKVKAIAIDLDGTLLNQQGQLSPQNAAAIRKAVDQGIKVILATGKTRSSATAIIEELALDTPGIYSQGLQVMNADGTVRHEVTLPQGVVARVVDFAQKQGIELIIYSREGLFASGDHASRHVLEERYHEPLPEVDAEIEAWPERYGVHKIVLATRGAPENLREQTTDLIGDDAHVTQAVPEYVEVLPSGTSKGGGLQRLLDDLGIPAAAVLAIGDGENDLEMLRNAGIGVAVGNAHPRVQEVADAVVGSNDESGVAEAIERFALNGSRVS